MFSNIIVNIMNLQNVAQVLSTRFSNAEKYQKG